MKPDVPPQTPGKKIAKVKPEIEEKEEISGLDAQTTQRVKDWSHAWLQDFYDEANDSGDDFGARLDFTKRVEGQISQLVGETDSHSKGLLTFKYREGVNIFLNTLIDFVQEKSIDINNKKTLQYFVRGLYEAMFSFSPNIANHIGLENLLVTTAKATRVPEAQGWFGQNMVGELTYELNWAHEDVVEKILTKIRKLGISEQLDVVHQLITVGADAIAQGEPGYEAHDRIVIILETVNQESIYPIVKYATENALAIIKEEEENPSLSVVTFQGNVAGARLPETISENLAQQNETFKRQIRFKNTDGRDYKYIQIASDAVGFLDHSNTPRQFAEIEVLSLPEPVQIDSHFVEQLKVGAESILNQQQFYDLLLHFTNLLLRQEKEKRSTTSDILADKWHKVSKQFSREEWDRIFSVILKTQEQEEKNAQDTAEFMQETSEANQRASNQFIDLVIEKYKGTIQSTSLPQRVRDVYEGLLKYRQDGNNERAFTSAESLALSDIELASALESLHETHAKNWRAYSDFENKLRPVETESSEFAETIELLVSKQDQLQADMLEFLQFIDNDLVGKLTTVEARPYIQIETDSKLNPFLESEGEQLTLLLQSLHNPTLRNFIETDLGINLSEIPLRSQIHFLRFLSGQDTEGFDRLRDVLQDHSDISNKILNSFLACAEDIGYSEYILKLGEENDSEALEKVLDKYLGIVSSANDIEKFLTEAFSNTEQKEGDIGKALPELTRKIIHQANLLLEKTAQGSVKGTVRLIAELETINTNALFLKSVYQYLRNDFKFKFSDLKSIELRAKHGNELSLEERQEIERLFIGQRVGDDRYSPELMESLLVDLRRALNSKENEFYILNYEHTPLAVIRFEHLENGDVYVGSLNVRQEVQGSSLGPEFMFSIKSLLEKRFKAITLRCEVMADKEDLVRVYTKLGFKTEGEEEKHGVKYYKMFRPPVVHDPQS